MRRTLWPLTAFGMAVMVAVVSAGCGGTQSSGGTSTAGAADTSSNNTTAAHTSTASHTSAVTAREKAVKFSECMRGNGVVATPSATLPVAGTVHNTNTLLGYYGFVGVKTGSDAAVGGGRAAGPGAGTASALAVSA